jgi:hypothetical protein
MYGVSTPFIIATIILGIITFYLYRDRLDDIEEECNQEQKEEKKRKEEFAGTFQRINKIPVFRWFVKWMYKEGLWYSVGLILIVLMGFGLRIYNLDFLCPVYDEYFHLVGAKRWMLEGDFNYNRAGFLTYIVGFLFKLNNGASLFLARFPIVIFGVLSIIAIYFLGKKINKKVGLIASYLLAFSPWAIGMSRYLREYQPYFLFVLIFLLFFIDFKDFDSIRKNNKKRFFIRLFIFALPAIYYFTIEKVSAIIEVYGMLIIFALVYFLFKFVKSEDRKRIVFNRKVYIALLVVLVLISTTLLILLEKYSWLITTNINEEPRYMEFLFNPIWNYKNLLPHWFSESAFSGTFVVFLIIFSVIFFYKNRYFISYFLVFLSICIGFSYFVNRYFAPRYIYYIFPFYIVILASSIFALINMRKLFGKKSYIYLFTIAVIFISFFSPLTALNGLLDEQNGTTDPKTELIHRDVFALMDYLKEGDFSEKDVLICSTPGIFNYYYNYTFITDPDKYPLRRVDYKNGNLRLDYGTFYQYYYDYKKHAYLRPCTDKVCEVDEMDRMNKIIQKYDSGWIIIDIDRNRNWNEKGFPLNNYSVGDRNIIYLGEVGECRSFYICRGFDIYRWMRSS